MVPFRIMAMDVSLTNTGIAIMEKDGKRWAVEHFWVIRTKKKKSRYVIYDTMRRIQEIVEELDKLYHHYLPAIAVAELPIGGGRSASAVEGMGIAKAVVATFAAMNDLPLEVIMPAETKLLLTGDRNGSKDKVQEAVYNRFEDDFDASIFSNRSINGFTNEFEHIADAIGAFMVAEKEERFM